MVTYEPPMCVGCRHYRRDDERDLTCDAFPGGIPAPILHGTADHRRPYQGDRGIRFAPVDTAAARYAAERFGEES